jgi:pSer/pThr/pTyr-binding forkhead associated (FHA) protein
MKDTIKIKFLSGTLQGTKYSIDPPMVCTIGRSDDCNIVIKDDGKISRRHCQIEVTDSILIKDLNSSNGILINGKEVDPKLSHPLADDDEVTIGDSILKIKIVQARDVTAAYCMKTNISNKKIKKDKTNEKKISIIEKFKNFLHEIIITANHTSSILSIKKNQHDNEKLAQLPRAKK